MRKEKSILLLCIISSMLISCSNTENVDHYKFVFGDMDENVMPISGWVAPASIGACNTLEQYKILKESGLNSIYSLYEQFGVKSEGIDANGNPKIYNGTEEIYKALEYAQEVGVKYFVRDPYIWDYEGEDFKNCFNERGYDKYSSFGGFHYSDEPQTHEQFESIAKSYNKFKLYVNPKYAFYINLNPLEFITNQHGTYLQYIDHVNDYLNTVDPRFFSYDMYCPKGDFPSVKGLYFKQLEIISEISEERKLPFWAFALATGHSFKTGGYYRSPREEDIYFQVNTILAFGAKAVQYFCYQTPLFTDELSRENYHEKGGSIINEKGEKSEIFPYIQKMNNYVAYVDHLLMNATKIGIMAVENNPACYLFNMPLSEMRDIVSIDCEDNLLVTGFDYKGKTLYYCVNTSLVQDSIFRLNFKKRIKYNIYSMDLTTSTKKSSSYSGILKPGRGVILETL